MKKNNIHDKVFDCPKCTNKTLTPVEHDKILGIGHGDICICEECGAELKAVPHYDFTVDFELNDPPKDEEEISDYLTDQTGYCHKGFALVEGNIFHYICKEDRKKVMGKGEER